MSIKSISPYLHFDGHAEAALRFYESVFRVQATSVMRFGEMPGADMPAPLAQRLMHSRLGLGTSTLMVSDTQPGQTPSPAGSVSVTLEFTDRAELRRVFDALAEGGEVTMPVADTFWGALFGMATDRFGVHWMFNCDHADDTKEANS